MKTKYIYKILVITIIAAVTIACNDTLDEIGFTQQPERDRVAVEVDTLELGARTVQVESVFARTRFPVLGEYSDPIFGSIRSEYVGNFFLHHGAGFTSGAVIDSVRLMLSYTAFMGDSLAPMQLSVYRVTQSLRGLQSVTDIDPRQFSDMSAPLGVQTFTGRNAIFRTETAQGQTMRIFDIPVTLPLSIGQEFLEEYLKPGRGNMANNNLFGEFFPGLFFTTTFGGSTIISVNTTSLFVHYHYLDEGGSSLQEDTIRTNALRLNITPEVIQINHINTSSANLLEPDAEHTFIKSPAGVNTEITFPISELYETMQRVNALNMANFTVFAMPDAMEEATVQLRPPNHLLLINRDSLSGFFENRRLPDNRTSFLSSQFDTQTFSYRFGNISAMINHYNQVIDGPYDLVYYLIPVEVGLTATGGGMSVSSIYNQMWPSAVTLDRREGSMRVELIFSSF